VLEQIRSIISEDVGGRGLQHDPTRNLVTACLGDFAAACTHLAQTKNPAIAVVTGFYIPHGQPPGGETDGPLGAVFLARALAPLGFRMVLTSEKFCIPALQAGLQMCGLAGHVKLVTLPEPAQARSLTPEAYRKIFHAQTGPLTHLIALERVGPSHTLESLQAQLGPAGALGQTYLDFLDSVPQDHQDRCHTMRGRDITDIMSPAHYLFEQARQHAVTTIGIGDGGNEIGMGKVPWDVIFRNISGGGLVACRVPTDRLLVCGISNWGAYGLAAGVSTLAGRRIKSFFDVDQERRILEAMVQAGPLVDGISGKQQATVDGLDFERYSEPLRRMAQVLGAA